LFAIQASPGSRSAEPKTSEPEHRPLD